MGDFNAKLEITKEMCTQTESRNGKALQSLIDRNRMEAINRLETHTGTWTRINTQNPDEKSIIDYIIVTQPVTELITESETDTNMMYKIAGKNPTDHRAITATIAINRENQKQYIRRWKKGTTQQWEAFNKKLQDETHNTDDNRYTKYHRTLLQTLKTEVGKNNIEVNKKYRITNEQIKTAKLVKKAAKAKFQTACRKADNSEEKIETKNDYILTQTNLRHLIEIEHTKQQELRVNKLIEEGGANSNTFWKIRKRLIKKKDEKYDLIDETGRKVTNAKDADEYIANYFEDLYQAREGESEQEEWTTMIENKVKDIETENNNNLDAEPNLITRDELDMAIRQLNKGKSVGPDDIPNEAIINMNKKNRDTLRERLNEVYTTKQIPEEWREGEIIRIYKGKMQQ